MKHKKISFLLFFLLCLYGDFQTVIAQVPGKGSLSPDYNKIHQHYTFSEIQEIFLKERPQTGDLAQRTDCFGSIDDMVLGTYPPLHPGALPFYQSMNQKVMLEIKNETVTKGATIWQIYNHGFVIKTPSVTFAIDISDAFSSAGMNELAEYIDAYFITHEHRDHYSGKLMTDMKNLNKPVVGPSEWSSAPTGMNAGETLTIANLTVSAHYGLHSVPVRQYEIITPEGFKFLHTGDNQTSETLPDIENVDVMLLNSWVNESGATSWIEGVRLAVNKINPKVTLPGHMMEIGHLYGGGTAVPYRDPITSDNGTLSSEYYILGWGERYHYDKASNDSTGPNKVESLSYTISSDTLHIQWQNPKVATDGDTASFYRILLNDSTKAFVADQKFSFKVKDYGLLNIKVYAYDECGNQSRDFAEIQEIYFNTFYENGALSLNNIGDFVQVPHSDILAPAQITVECWIYLDGKTGEQTIVDKRWDSGGYNFRVVGDSYPLGIAFVIKDQQESILATGGLFDLSTWYHVAGTYDGITQSVYVDGELISSINVNKNISNTTSDFTIGELTGANASELFFKGNIDELRIWDIAKSQEEIKADKDDILTGDESHLVGYWTFDEYKSTFIADTSPYHNNGTLQGNAQTIQSTAPIGPLSDIQKNTTVVPQQFALAQNYPNPFNPVTHIQFRIKGICYVKLNIYNIQGCLVASLVKGEYLPGSFEITFNSGNLSSGIYFYRLQAGDFSDVKKMILLD